MQGWVERGCLQPCQVKVGIGHMQQLHADMGLDCTAFVPVQATISQVSHFISLVNIFMHCSKEKIHICNMQVKNKP